MTTLNQLRRDYDQLLASVPRELAELKALKEASIETLRERLIDENSVIRRLLTDEPFLEPTLQNRRDELMRELDVLVAEKMKTGDNSSSLMLAMCLRAVGQTSEKKIDSPHLLEALVNYPAYLEREAQFNASKDKIEELKQTKRCQSELDSVGGAVVSIEQLAQGKRTLEKLELDLARRKGALKNLNEFEDVFLKKLNYYLQENKPEPSEVDIDSERMALKQLISTIRKS